MRSTMLLKALWNTPMFFFLCEDLLLWNWVFMAFVAWCVCHCVGRYLSWVHVLGAVLLKIVCSAFCGFYLLKYLPLDPSVF